MSRRSLIVLCVARSSPPGPSFLNIFISTTTLHQCQFVVMWQRIRKSGRHDRRQAANSYSGLGLCPIFGSHDLQFTAQRSEGRALTRWLANHDFAYPTHTACYVHVTSSPLQDIRRQSSLCCQKCIIVVVTESLHFVNGSLSSFNGTC